MSTKELSPDTCVGYVRSNGELSCIECTSSENFRNPVYIDSYPHAFEVCDFCYVILNDRFKERVAK